MKHNEEGTALEALMEHVIVVMGLVDGRMSTAWMGRYSILFTKSKSGDQTAEVTCYKQRRNVRNLHSVSRPSI